MTDKTIRRAAIVFIGAAAAACGAVGARYNSMPWIVIAIWLLFALVVETWPRK